MKFRSFLLILASVFLLPFVLSAQTSKLKEANRYFENLNYQDAIETYLEILDKRDLTEAKIKLAEAYRKVGNYKESAYWYGQVARVNGLDPIIQLNYGMALQSVGKCDEAIPYFEAYSKAVPSDYRGQLLKEACETTRVEALLVKGSEFYELVPIPNINSDLDEFGPAFYKDGLVFTSERDKGGPVNRIHSWTGNPFLEMYFTQVNAENANQMDFAYTSPEKFENLFNTRLHDGPLVFSSSGNTVYYTRNNVLGGKVGRDNEGIVRLKVFSSSKVEDKWTDPKGLPFNSDEYSVAHPALSPDNKQLYFASDMPGGFGGMDLYVSSFADGRWGPPINMNLYVPTINTEGDELFPFVHKDGTVYFSSNGRDGLGGLDIYQVRKIGDAYGPITNLGFPLNSFSDDFSLILNEARSFGYFASNRSGGVGNDDLYAYKRLVVDVEVYVYDELTGDPINEASIGFDCASGSPIKTDASGRAFFETGLEKQCTIKSIAAGFEDGFGAVNTSENKAGDQVLVQIAMLRPLDFDIVGTIKDTDGNPVANATIELSSDCAEAPIFVNSDSDGNFDLEIDPDCCYLVKGTKDQFIPATENICTRGRTASETFNIALVMAPEPEDDDTIEIDSLMAIGLPLILHPFDKPNWRKESARDLAMIKTFMDANPDLMVLVASHTDSRGTEKYNDRLSRRRANAIRRFLVKRDIDESRLLAFGYGERQLLNECEDGVRCSRDQHQQNRRTELKVVGRVPGGLFPAYQNLDLE
ncbi:MAG: OmpA family protein [Bacteroidota bacterium]